MEEGKGREVVRMVVSAQHRQIVVGVVARECRREVEEEQEEVTIVCQDGQEVYTNRALLSLLSPLLRPMLSSSSTLFLPDHSKATLLALLHLLRGEWRGEVRVSREVATLATTLAINMPLVQAENRQQEIPVLTLDEEEDSSVKDIDAEIDAEIEAVDGELETNIRYPKKRKADENEQEYPVKRVRVLLKNVKAPFEYTDQQVAQTKPLEQNEPNDSGPETETESIGSEPRSSPAGCKVCEKTFQNEERLLRHYCHKHFSSQLTSLVPDYFDGHTCKVCGLQFLQQNAINLRSHIGIDHQRLDEFIENISVHSENSAQTQNINIEEVSEKTSDATRNDEETTAEMNLEEIQKYLLSYQSNDEEETEKLLAEDDIDDEIMELELPTKPAAPFIDLVFEEDEHDTKLMEIIDDTLQRMDTEV